MNAALRQLSDQLDDATQRLLGSARVIAEPDLRAPSLLPGWTRAHLLAHLARNADALRNLLVGARSGELRAAYTSQDARAADIEHGSRQPAKQLLEDLAATAMALRTIIRQLPDDAWRFPVRILDSPAFPAAEVLTRRLVEVELHHGDLGTGYGPADWPAAFAAMDLSEPMRSWRRDRLSHAARAARAGRAADASGQPSGTNGQPSGTRDQPSGTRDQPSGT